MGVFPMGAGRGSEPSVREEAAADRSYEGGCVQCGPVTATNPLRRSAPLGF
jgi:hypothetical protein